MYICDSNEWNKTVQLAPIHNLQIVNNSLPTKNIRITVRLSKLRLSLKLSY